MPIDRRVARTRTALYEGLLALIRRKDYDAISVEDILAESDVGRSTFYAHFSSKDDLLASSLERLRTLLRAAQQRGPGASGATGPSRTLFEHVGEFTDIQLALAGGRGAAIVREAVDEVLADILRAGLPGQAQSAVPRELAIRHIVATFNTVLRWWLVAHPELTPEQADLLFNSLVIAGLPAEWQEPFLSSFGTAEKSEP